MFRVIFSPYDDDLPTACLTRGRNGTIIDNLTYAKTALSIDGETVRLLP